MSMNISMHSLDADDKLPLSLDGGCSGKIPKNILQNTLKDLPQFKDSRIVIDGSSGDDAGVIMLSETEGTVLTLDIFTAMTDHPYDFGQIAAANAVSDIYAMGAKPQSALSFIGFPAKQLPSSLMREILRGGADKLAEANIAVIGGHSIEDPQIKCGYAVVGTLPKSRIIPNHTAQKGDVILLTKPIGNGIIAFAHKHKLVSPSDFEQAILSMKTLNKIASESLEGLDVHALTDITGFGLLGHLSNILMQSRVKATLSFDKIPIFNGVKSCVSRSIYPRALNHNMESLTHFKIDFANLSQPQQYVLFSPETSGGLLVFISEKDAEIYIQRMNNQGMLCEKIGQVTDANCDAEIVCEPTQQPWEKGKAVTFKKADNPSPNAVCAFTYVDSDVGTATPIWKQFAQKLLRWISTQNAPIIAGLFLGLFFVGLAYFGNPKNMGICVACFVRDTAGSLGLHTFWGGCYIRPELIGIILGAMLSAFIFGEFKARASNNGLVSLVLGASGMMSSLLFLGCPWRAFGRLFSGDLTALTGGVGLIVGVAIGSYFLKLNFQFGVKQAQSALLKWILPVIAVGLLALSFVPPTCVPTQDTHLLPLLSTTGPAKLHAPFWIALGIGCILGVILQRSRFCTIGGFRDLFLFRHIRPVLGIASFAVATLIFAFLLGSFHWGFENQAASHSFYGLSFFAMLTGGITFTLAGGCPGRQLTMAASGDGNAFMFVIGMGVSLPLLSALQLLTVNANNITNAWILCTVLCVISLVFGLGMRGKNH